METKRCKCCQRVLPVNKFNTARDAYTDQARWVRNVCMACYHKPRQWREQRVHFAAVVPMVQLSLW